MPRQWALRGTRLEDGAQLFTYDTRANRILLPFLRWLGPALLLVGLGLVALGVTIGGEPLRYGVLALIYGLTFTAIGCHLRPLDRATRERRSHWVTTDHVRIAFGDGIMELWVRWEEVRDYYRTSRSGGVERCVVVTRQGEIEFLRTLARAAVLAEVIRTRASGGPGRWRAAESEALPLGQAYGAADGARRQTRVFHFRTRTNRALLWLPEAMPLLCWLSAALAYAGFMPEGRRHETGGMIAVGCALAAAAALLYAAYRTGRVELSEDQITVRGLRGTCSMPWTEVRNFAFPARDFGTFLYLDNGRRRLRISTLIGDVEELEAEIRRRVAGAG